MVTTYFKNLVAGNVFGSKTTPAIPSTYYIGLSTSAPDEDGTGATEPSSSAGYARVAISNLGDPVNGEVSNEQAISFNESTSSWGTITHYVIYDAATSGNLLMYGQFLIPRIVETGTTLRENDLRVLETILPISARLIANKASFKFKYEGISRLAKLIAGAAEGGRA